MAPRQRFALALGLSLLLHGGWLALPQIKPKLDAGSLTALIPPPPFSVRIVDAEKPAAAAPPEAQPQAAAPMPRPLPVPRKAPSRLPSPVPPERLPPPAPEPLPTPTPAPAPMDMAALVEARRERRKAAESAAGRQGAAKGEAMDPGLASANRNLQTLAPGAEGPGGVFQILRKGTRTAEFAFNGWRPTSSRSWREVIEVDAGLNGDIDRAIVKRMIKLIRDHYTGDFQWESHRLGRVVTLSARPGDNEGLEDFMIREFFGTPTLRR